ncbi:MAG: GAF domain-containing protein [Chloroflexota bacterium]
MLLNIRWGSLRAKLVAWFFVPSAIILVGIALVAYLALQSNTYRGVMALLLLSSLVIPVVVVGLGVKRIAKPIAELTQAAQEVAQGNFGLTVTADTGDEIEELAVQFNKMSGQLQNAYNNLERMVAARTSELETLNTVAEVVSCSLNLDEILTSALSAVLERLDIQAGAMLLLEDGTFKLRAQQGLPANSTAKLEEVAAKGISAQAISQGKLIILDIESYAAQSGKELANLLQSEGIQALLSAPLVHKEKALGAMTLVCKQACDRSPQEQNLLLSIGQQIGVAIENAQLYEKAQQEIERRKQIEGELRRTNEESTRRNRELTLLNQVITATTSGMEPKAILEVVCGSLVNAFGVAQSAAALLNEEKTTLTVIAEYKSEHYPSAMGVIIPVAENPASLYVMKQKKPLALPDAQNDILLTPVRDVMRQRGTVSLLILPIVVRDEVIGTIGVDATERREFSEAEISLAERVTAAVGQVLERANLDG